MAQCVYGQIQERSVRFLEYPLSLPGQIFKVHKALDSASGKIWVESDLGQSLSPIGIREREVLEERVEQSQRGKLSRELSRNILSMNSSETKRVKIILRYPPIAYPDKTKGNSASLAAASWSAANLAPVAEMGDIAARHGLGLLNTSGSGNGIVFATKAQLLELQGDGDIAAVEESNDEFSASPELTTLAPSAYNPGPVPSGAGYNVNAATFEFGLSQGFLNCIGVTPVLWDAYTTSNLTDQRHSEAVFRCLAAAAPSANFYHRRSLVFDGTSDVNYLLNNSIQTVSISQTRGGTSPYRSTYSEFLTMDDFAYRSPYPVFVTPSANAGYQYECNWQGYNGISVGNVRHTDNSTFEFADCTQTKNPPPVYGSCISGSGADCAGDREMPIVVAPGIPYTGTTFATTCLDGQGGLNCGTSFSAPIANGIAADLLAADSRMSAWPEKVRAAMVLTAQNVDGGDWSYATDGRDGSGTVSGSEGVSFAQNHTSVSPGNSAVEKGMGASSMYASDFSGANKRFYVAAPNPLPSGKHLRVVLTWDSNPVVGGGVNALSDLDLIVQTNSGTSGSYSWDGNVEVVDVSNGSLTSGSTYWVDVDPVINRIPTSGSRTDYFYWSIAWEWVADHAP